MQIPCVYLPGPAPAVSVANRNKESIDSLVSIEGQASLEGQVSIELGV